MPIAEAMDVTTNPYQSPESAAGERAEAPLRRASAWQLSWISLVMSAARFASAPLVAILAVHLWRYGDRAPGVLLLHAWLARIACLVVLGVCCMSIGFAWAARKRAQQERESAAIPAASLMFSILSTLAWLLAGYALLNTTESLIR